MKEVLVMEELYEYCKLKRLEVRKKSLNEFEVFKRKIKVFDVIFKENEVTVTFIDGHKEASSKDEFVNYLKNEIKMEKLKRRWIQCSRIPKQNSYVRMKIVEYGSDYCREKARKANLKSEAIAYELRMYNKVLIK